MQIFARHTLLPLHLPGGEGALLLEGDWPAVDRSPQRRSLDGSIDARFAWIDALAQDVAEEIRRRAVFRLAGLEEDASASLASINALALRYYLVKLLRVVAFFEMLAPPGDCCRFYGQSRRDEDYAALLAEIARRHGFLLHCVLDSTRGRPRAQRSRPHNGWWRRMASQANRLADHGHDLLARTAPDCGAGAPPRVVLCGNPRLLDGLCAELARRRCRIEWLYDRFAFGNWRAWRRFGVRQLNCNASQGRRHEFVPGPIGSLLVRGVDLGPAIDIWLKHLCLQRGASQTKQWRTIEAHFQRSRPSALVLDEDATPLNRIAAAVARRHGTCSYVVQHGAPRVRFGFAPLAADRFLAWGAATRNQLARWGIAEESIEVVGSPRIWPRLTQQADRRTILFCATTPPASDRPDATAYHLTAENYQEMLAWTCQAVESIGGYELAIKLHPRSADSKLVRQIASRFAGLRFRIVQRGPIEPWLSGAACVINCGSSAGIEAACYGAAVIEVLPRGSLELTPAAQWGLFGAARDTGELISLLRQALAAPPARTSLPCRSPVFAAFGQQAAIAAANAILSAAQSQSLPSPLCPAGGVEEAVR